MKHEFVTNYQFDSGYPSYEAQNGLRHSVAWANEPSLFGGGCWHTPGEYYNKKTSDGKCYEYPIDRILPEEMWVT